MLKEIFVDIEGFGGKYQVSNRGTVLNVTRQRILKPWDNGNGYLYIRIGKNKKSHGLHTSIHRLVASHFLVKGEGKTEVNHINSIKTDNRVDNLEWVTPSENSQHRQDTLDISREVKAMVISPDGELFEVINTGKFAREKGLVRESLRDMISGRIKSTLGWKLFK